MQVTYKIVNDLRNTYSDTEHELRRACVDYIRETVFKYGKRSKNDETSEKAGDSGLRITLDLKAFLRDERLPKAQDGKHIDVIEIEYDNDNCELLSFVDTGNSKTYHLSDIRKNIYDLVDICGYLNYCGNFKIQEG